MADTWSHLSEPVRAISDLIVLFLLLFFKQGPDGLPMPGCWQKVRREHNWVKFYYKHWNCNYYFYWFIYLCEICSQYDTNILLTQCEFVFISCGFQLLCLHVMFHLLWLVSRSSVLHLCENHSVRLMNRCENTHPHVALCCCAFLAVITLTWNAWSL